MSTEELFDFGFTLVDEDELDVVQETGGSRLYLKFCFRNSRKIR